MSEFRVRFSLNNEELRANFGIEQTSIPTIFKINAAGTTWGSISGNINNQTDLINVLNTKQGVLTAGENINIQGDVISAVDTTYTAGTGIDITNGVISNTQTSAEWGNIQGDISDQTDLQNALNEKQDTISDLSTIREDASEGTSAYSTIQTYGDIVTYNAANFATAAQGITADTALQPNDNISELVNDVGYITSASVGDGKLSLQVNSVDVGEFTANQSTATTVNITVPTDLGDLTNNAKYLKNTATATDSISVYGTSNSSWTNGINIGAGSLISSNNGIAIGVDASADINAVAYGRDADAGTRGTAIGAYAKTSYDTGIAIGCWNANTNNAKSTAKGAYQFGVGTNNTARTLNVGWYDDSVHPSTFRNYQLLDGNTGLIPDARISTNIARTLDMTTADNNLQDQIDVLKARGRFLALWNCATGLAESNPPQSPYTYHAGDYFIVGVVSTANPPVNYKPDGSSYTTGVASTTLETNVVDVDDVYYYDGTTWKLQINTQKTTSFVNIAGSPYDNTALANALNSKLDLTGGTMSGNVTFDNGSDWTLDIGNSSINIDGDNESLGIDTGSIYFSNTYGSTQLYTGGELQLDHSDNDDQWYFFVGSELHYRVSNDGGTTEYEVRLDSSNGYLQIPTPAENYSLVNNDAAITAGWLKTYLVPLIPTDTSDLTNDAGYITGITSSDVTTALGYTPYNATNPNGYISGITSGDVTTALGYTPYNSTNPSGYISGITSGDVTTALGYTPLSDSTKYGADLSYSSNTLQLLDQDGNNLGNSVTIQSSPDIDGITITKNIDDELQTVAVIDQNNTSNGIKTWTGTKAQYDAIVSKDANTLYNITDDTDVTLSLLELLYPIGSIYIGTMATCPLATLGVGTWQLVAVDRVLQGATDGSVVGTTKSAGLPNITGSITTFVYHNPYPDTPALSGAMYKNYATNTLANVTSSTSGGFHDTGVNFSASNSSSIYGNSNTVQPPAYLVNIWERTA